MITTECGKQLEIALEQRTTKAFQGYIGTLAVQMANAALDASNYSSNNQWPISCMLQIPPLPRGAHAYFVYPESINCQLVENEAISVSTSVQLRNASIERIAVHQNDFRIIGGPTALTQLFKATVVGKGSVPLISGQAQISGLKLVVEIVIPRKYNLIFASY